MRTEGSIEVDRPINDVFRLTNDHVAEWSMIVVEEGTIRAIRGTLNRPRGNESRLDRANLLRCNQLAISESLF